MSGCGTGAGAGPSLGFVKLGPSARPGPKAGQVMTVHNQFVKLKQLQSAGHSRKKRDFFSFRMHVNAGGTSAPNLGSAQPPNIVVVMGNSLKSRFLSNPELLRIKCLLFL